jgi:peptide chain release factor 1
MSIIDKLKPRLLQIVEEHQQLQDALSDPAVTQDLDRYRKLSKESADAGEVVEAWHSYLASAKDLAEAEAMKREADKANDSEMVAMAQDEIESTSKRLEQIEQQLIKLLLPKDPDDHYHALLEIRAGTGGDESCLFAGDVFRMYSRYAERQRWSLEVMSRSEAEVGGFKEIICRIEGKNVYGRLKFESGGHRVQRVPETETQGRVHTSACTVAVMPEIPEQEIQINPADLRVDTFRASGAGGQHVNKTDSAVRITHVPTGIVVECQDDRSQHRNRARAYSILASRIHEQQREAQQKKEAATRKSLIGSGDRSERIRTYNFPQGRMTDHRINLTLYKLAFIMDGDLDEMLDALAMFNQAQMLECNDK